MGHIALGAVSTVLHNTTPDKTLTLTRDLDVGTLLVAVAMGYGVDGTIALTSVTDSEANTWDTISGSAAAPSRFAMVAWSRLDNAMSIGDTVLVNMTGSYSRGIACLRAYEGLGATETAKTSANNYGNPATSGPIATVAPGRAIAAAFYPTEFFSTNEWINSFTQTVIEPDIPNVDTFTVGERAYTSGSSVTPALDIGVSSYYIIAAVTLPEQPMPLVGSGRRRSPIVL